MITESAVVLASRADARAIAEMSREYIERGLGWGWTEARVDHAIVDPEINVAVVRDGTAILAFGIMSYRRDAGIRSVEVECRRDNDAARNFYGEHGYHERVIAPRYYRGVEDAVRLEKWLAVPEAS